MSRFSEKFKSICDSAKLVGANFVVVKDDKIIDQATYGKQSLENNIDTKTDTIYRIASISKTVGVIGLMQLYEENKIDLDKDISEYFGFKIRNPKFPEVAITPRMLVTQTSSITDGYDDENPQYDDIHLGYNGVNGTNWDVSVEDLLVPDKSKYYTPLTYSDFEPGTNFIYSNFGCGLMACLIEIASGEYYTEYMKKHVFSKLGVDASFCAKDIVKKELVADLYSVYDGKICCSVSAKEFIEGGYKKFPLGTNFRGPAGGLFISMPDLAKIMRVLINRGEADGVRLLKEETVDLMYQIQWFGTDDEGDYRAKGLQMKIMHNFEDKGIVFRGHTGGAYGVRSYMYYNEKNKIGACFITNGGFPKRLPEGILDIFKETLEVMIDEYYPEATPSIFAFSTSGNFATVDDRKIYFRENAYEYNDEVYIPAMSLADGLGIVGIHNEKENSVTYNFKGKGVRLVNLTDFDKTLMAPVLYVCKELGIDAKIENGEVEIKY